MIIYDPDPAVFDLKDLIYNSIIYFCFVLLQIWVTNTKNTFV